MPGDAQSTEQPPGMTSDPSGEQKDLQISSNFNTYPPANVAMDNPPFIDDVQIQPPLIVDFQLPWITAGQVTGTPWETFLGLAAVQPHVRPVFAKPVFCMQNNAKHAISKNPSQDMARKKQHVTCFR